MYMYYLKRGFQITTLHVDSKFAPTQELIHEITGWGIVNIASDSENVSEIERQIRAEKESIRFIINSLPFNKFSKIFLIHLVFQSIKILNHFPVKGCFSDTISFITIMIGTSLHYKNYLIIKIGKYCQVHK